MVYIEESHTVKYLRVKDQFLSTKQHFYDSRVSQDFHSPKALVPTKQSTGLTLRNTGSSAIDTNVELFQSTLAATAVKAPDALTRHAAGLPRFASRSAGLSRSCEKHPVLEDRIIRSMSMPGYMYKANGLFEDTYKRLDLPRPHSVKLDRNAQLRKSTYATDFTGRTRELPSLTMRSGKTTAGSIASKHRMAMNGYFGYDGGLSPDKP